MAEEHPVGQAVLPADPLSSGSSRLERWLRPGLAAPQPEGLLIIGYGNPLRADDASGPRAARRLARLGFNAVEAYQLTPDLAEPIAAAQRVIFLDAHTGIRPGEIAIEQVVPHQSSSALDHHATPAGLLQLAKEAYGVAPEATLISLGGDNFGIGAKLSTAAQRSVSKAVEEVLRSTSFIPAGQPL